MNEPNDGTRPALLSRSAAKGAGLKRYFTGKSCPQGHIAERMTSNAVCVDCLHNRQRQRLKDDPALASAKRKQWRLNHPAWFVAQNEKWRERRKQLTRIWREENKARHRLNRHASLKTHAARHPEREFSRRVLRLAVRYGIIQKEPCWVCGAAEVEAHHKDYFTPLDVIWLCRKHHQEAHQ